MAQYSSPSVIALMEEILQKLRLQQATIDEMLKANTDLTLRFQGILVSNSKNFLFICCIENLNN